MSNRVLVWSDAHIHPHKRSVERLNNCLEALDWVFATAKEKKITNLVFAGDLFQDRQKIDVLTYHLTFNVFAKYCDGTINVYLLLGNHDLWFQDRWDISSVYPLSALPGVTVVNSPSTLEVGDLPVDFLPYTIHPVEHIAELEKACRDRKGRKNLIAHLAVHGAQLNTLHNTRSDVIIEHDAEMVKVEPVLFKSWDQVFLGHYHGQQKISDNAEYVGSLLQLTFGEAFQHKHVIVYDLDAGTKEYIRNKFSPQHFIIPASDIEKYDIEKNFIRLMVEDMGSSDVVDTKKVIEKLNPGSIEIIPVEKEEYEHVVQDATALLHKEDDMIEEYLKQVDVGILAKDKLSTAGKKVISLVREE